MIWRGGGILWCVICVVAMWRETLRWFARVAWRKFEFECEKLVKMER